MPLCVSRSAGSHPESDPECDPEQMRHSLATRLFLHSLATHLFLLAGVAADDYTARRQHEMWLPFHLFRIFFRSESGTATRFRSLCRWPAYRAWI